MRTASFSTPNTPLDLDLSPLPFYCGERNGNPLQYSCLENSMDRGAWWATVHGASKSWTRLSDHHWHSLRCTEQSLLLSVEDKPSHCILEGLPLSLLGTFCLAIIFNVSRDQSFLPLHCNGSVSSVEICCTVSHLHKSMPLLAHILCTPSLYSPSQQQCLHCLSHFSYLPFSSLSPPPFLPHHVNKTIPIIVTKSLHLVKSKWKVSALLFLDLAVAFGPDDILFSFFFLTFYFVLEYSQLTMLW